MKQIMLFGIMLTALAPAAQSPAIRHVANYEAAYWNTRMLDDSAAIKISAPPLTTAFELKTVKQSIAGADDQKRKAIVYWNAGAPSYRWNQITPQLMDQKPDSWLRIPTAWVNLAIYDATILACK
jgi:hypothetical protein